MSRIGLFLLAVFTAGRVLAFDVTTTGRIEQGGLIIGTAPPGSKVTVGERTVPVTATGRFLVGLDRDAPASLQLSVAAPDGSRESKTLAVAARQWQIEKVDGVPQQLVTPDPELAAKISAEQKLMVAARAKLELTPFFESGLIRPAEGRISGVFGSQRILNGSPRAAHAGLDIAGPIGTPVHAAADGVVSLQKENMILTGDTVVLNHGYGLETVYIHMSAIHVADGQRVKQGDVIGEIGMTGRANGPHLHFGVTWFDTRLDPETVLAVLPAVKPAITLLSLKILDENSVAFEGNTIPMADLEDALRRAAARDAHAQLEISPGMNNKAADVALRLVAKAGFRVGFGTKPDGQSRLVAVFRP